MLDTKRSVDVARPPHLEALIGAKPRILDMIQGAATAGLRSEQPLLARLDTLIEAATAAFLDALDDSEKTHSQAALAKKHPKQLTTHGSEQYKNTAAPPSRTRPCQKSNTVASHPSTVTTTSSPHLLHSEKAGSPHHSSKPHFPDCLTDTDCDA